VGFAVGQPQQIFSGWQSDGTLDLHPAHEHRPDSSERFRSVRRESGLLESLRISVFFAAAKLLRDRTSD